ncbi:hypothetical protein ADIS_1299 [Lunatimonas lonarensis]|uniref:Uncharacterized protein n=1 Tax=Lunatimonas lonarensis TaxID=1232681 RepID=R7ZVK7_9BACT|nr:hypothetical protein ADIS_1299 [Lunatimonas lonarensis]
MNNSGFSGFMGISPNKLPVLPIEHLSMIYITWLVCYFHPYYADRLHVYKKPRIQLPKMVTNR